MKLILLIVFTSCIWWSSSAYGIKKIRIGLGEPNLPIDINGINVEDKWFVQKLDHFNPTDNRTWNQVINN